MIIRSLALTGLLMLAAGSALYTPPAEARSFVSVRIGPPAPRFERVVVRPGYIWAPGYWRWNGRTHVWVGGGYLVARPGRVWHPGHWVNRGVGWFYREGHWGR